MRIENSRRDVSKTKRLFLYLLRWQLSTPVLAACIMLFPSNDIAKTVLANLIGGLIFYKVDKLIFRHGRKVDV